MGTTSDITGGPRTLRTAAAPAPGAASYEAARAIALAEMVGALGPDVGPRLRRLASFALEVPARALARSLCALDADIAASSLPAAALARLRHYGVEAHGRAAGPDAGAIPLSARPSLVPTRGPLLVVANHPGLYDCLALFAAVGRDDLATLAAARPLFEALPNLSRHLVRIPEPAGASALRSAVRHLRAGRSLLHFPAGCIEPDPWLCGPNEPMFQPWKPGIDGLVALAPQTSAVAALVSGVVSRRARRLSRTLLGRTSATDALVPLLELTLPGFGDVDVRVRFGPVRSAKEPGLVKRLRADLAFLAND